jgi:hypothetical protein
MPSKSKKQLNFFKLVKAYVDNGSTGVVDMWKKLFPKKAMPNAIQLEKIIDVSKKINYSDLEDMVSGINGVDNDFGNKQDFKVGYWIKFDAFYSDYQGNKNKNTFIAKITRVRPDIKLVNFNSEDIYNKNGFKIAPVRRPNITSTDFMWLDFAYFDQIKEVSKDKKELIMKSEIRNIVRKTINEVSEDSNFATSQENKMLMRSLSQIIKQIKIRTHFTNEELMSEISKMLNQYDNENDINESDATKTNGLTIKHRDTGEDVSVKTGMLIQSATDETSKGKVKNVGINFETIPNRNNLNIYWYHGDKAGTTQKVDLNDVVAI